MITQLNEVKQYLGLSLSSEYDNVLSSMILKADNQLQNYLGGMIENDEIEYRFKVNYDTESKTLPYQIVNEITELAYKARITDDWTVIDSSYYELETSPYKIVYDTFKSGITYKATLDVGYESENIPESIKQAGLEMTATMFKESDILKGDTMGRLGIKTINSSSSVSGSVNITFENVWNKWKSDLQKFKIIATGIK